MLCASSRRQGLRLKLSGGEISQVLESWVVPSFVGFFSIGAGVNNTGKFFPYVSILSEESVEPTLVFGVDATVKLK